MLLRRDESEERDEHIDMTPMVDVVFQLMTFMLFSVQMSGAAKVDVPPARHGVGVEETAATFLTLLKPARRGESLGSSSAMARGLLPPSTRPARPLPTARGKGAARSSSRPTARSQRGRF